MARGKKSNPIDDIVNTVGGWLGGGARALDAAVNVGRSPSTNKQTAKAAEAVYNVLDTATNNGVTAIRNGPDAFQSYAQQQMLLMGLGIAAEPVAMAGGRALAKTGVARKVLPKVVQKVFPAEIGVHHSVAMKGQPFTGTVRGSKAGRSLTAMDQQAGQSYFWSTKGRGGASKAAQEVKFQTEEIAFKYVDFPETSTSMGYVTKVPRGMAKVDPNLPGSTARQVAGGTQKIVKSVAGTGDPYYAVAKSFTDEDVRKLTNAVRAAKAVEVAKSAAKIGGPAGIVGGAAAAVTKKRGRGGGGSKKRTK